MNPFDSISSIFKTAGLFGNLINDPNVDLIPGIGGNEPKREAVKTTNNLSNELSNFTGSQTTAQRNDGTVLDSTTDTPNNLTGGARAYTAADEQAAYDDQIANYNRLLSLIGAQSATGLQSLQESLASQKNRLGEQKTSALKGYDDQRLENDQNKQRGVQEVDSFANNSYNSLQRLLSGANAGSSSVARELVPYLVSKSAGTRRTNVFDTAGRNEQAIVGARGKAEDEFRYSEEDLDNQAKQQESNFRQTVLNQENDILAERRDAEMKRAMASGAGYQSARQAAAASSAGINDRTAQLTSLFGQFKPTFTARAMNLQKPELSQYTVDKAQINSQNQGLPAESSFYQSMLKKKQEQF